MQKTSEKLQSVLDTYVEECDLPGANATLFIEGAQIWAGTSGCGKTTFARPFCAASILPLRSTVQYDSDSAC